MPYVIMKRDDIPAGVLQVLDLVPNTSQHNQIYEAVPQTKYVRAVQNEAATLLTNGGVITFATETRGLIAWLLTNVDDGTGVAATGTITTIVQANLLDNETFTISDGTTSTVFAFHVTGAYAPVVGEVEVDVTAAVTANDVRDAIITAVQGVASFFVTATSGGASTVTLTNDNVGTAGNVVVTDTVVDAGFTHTGMAGGVDADALTAAEASTDADDILGLLNFGAAGAAGVLDLAAINGALSTGQITAGQVTDILDILAGREYLVPAGVQVQAASAFVVSPAIDATGGPAFVAGTLRNLYATDSLTISFYEGALSKYTSSSFSYGGVSGVALAVYENDGTLFA